MIFAAGTGNPYFTTDTAAALRALEIGAEAILMAKNGVRGVFDGDPRTTPTRSSFPRSPTCEAIERGLKVMDTTALSLCMDNQLPIHVFELAPATSAGCLPGARGHAHLDPRRRDAMSVDRDFIANATERMNKSVEATHEHFNSVRTGRASAALLDRIQIDYYGTPSPLKNLATINVPEPRMLTIQPFDPAAIKQIERAIMESDLGLTPSNDGKVIRLPIPQLTEERRKELAKVVRNMAEEGRVAVRNVRRDVMASISRSSCATATSATTRSAPPKSRVQKLTDEHVAQDRRSVEAQGSGDHGGVVLPFDDARHGPGGVARSPRRQTTKIRHP